MAPAVSALSVFLFLTSWNMFLLPIVMITETSMRTVPTGLANFVGQYTLSTTWLMAGAIISSIPVIIVYVIFQRHFVQGLMSGAVRG
jgi:raffinose/stachyose/melibiose transport system permease protein